MEAAKEVVLVDLVDGFDDAGGRLHHRAEETLFGGEVVVGHRDSQWAMALATTCTAVSSSTGVS